MEECDKRVGRAFQEVTKLERSSESHPRSDLGYDDKHIHMLVPGRGKLRK